MNKFKLSGPLELAVILIAFVIVVVGAVFVALGHISESFFVGTVLPLAGALPVVFGVPKSISLLGGSKRLNLADVEHEVPNIESLVSHIKNKDYLGAITVLEDALPQSSESAAGLPPDPRAGDTANPRAEVSFESAHDQTEVVPSAPSPDEVANAKSVLARAAGQA